jgi:hypothetical protein
VVAELPFDTLNTNWVVTSFLSGSYPGLFGAFSSAAKESSVDEQAVKPNVLESAIALNKAKLKYFFIVIKIG